MRSLLVSVSLALVSCAAASPTAPTASALVSSSAGPSSSAEPAPPVEPKDAASPVAALAPTPPLVTRLLGDAAPIGSVQSGASGRWVAYCMAPRDTDGDGRLRVPIGMHGELGGDAVELRMQVGEGPSEPVEALLGADPSGRWVVVRRSSLAQLIDAERGARTLLTADSSRFVDFDAGRMLYATPGERPAVVVRTLATGEERRLDPGPGKLLSATLEGDFVALSTIPKDTNRDGALAVSRGWTNLAKGPCRGPAASASFFGGGGSGDATQLRLVRLTGGDPREVADLVALMGGSLVRRATNGALLLERDDGSTAELSSAACQGRVVATHRASSSVLVACRVSDEDARLELHRDGEHIDLGATVHLFDSDPARDVDGPLHSVPASGGREVVVDLERARVRELTFARITHSDDIVLLRGRRILLRREASLYLTDFDDPAEHRLPGEIEKYPSRFAEGRVAFVQPLVVDVDAGVVLGSTGRAPVYGVIASGNVLAAPPPPNAYVLSDLRDGPLAWRWAEPL